jgi:glycosyltransferase involved in cell wall biosynthesis
MTGSPDVISPGILHVVAGEDFGGASVVVAALADAAVRSGFRATVLTSDPRLAERLHANGVGTVDSIPIRRTVHPLADLVAVVRLTRHVRRHGYRIVHTHTSKGGLVGRVAAHLAKVPLIVHTAHGFAFHEGSTRIRCGVAVRAEQALSHLTDRIVTVTDHHRELALSHRIAPADKMLTIHNGIDDPLRLSPCAPDREPDGRARFVVLSHGRLCTQKGVAHLVRAMSLLPAPSKDRCRLVIVGEGELAGELGREVARLGIGAMVEFLGFRTDPVALVREADLVVLPSLWEGLSISLLEALALGKPVIATAIPSNIEVVGDSGCAVLVPPADPAALALAIGRLLDCQEERTSLSRAARRRYEAEFAADRMGAAYVDLYRKAMPA